MLRILNDVGFYSLLSSVQKIIMPRATLKNSAEISTIRVRLDDQSSYSLSR